MLECPHTNLPDTAAHLVRNDAEALRLRAEPQMLPACWQKFAPAGYNP